MKHISLVFYLYDTFYYIYKYIHIHVFARSLFYPHPQLVSCVNKPDMLTCVRAKSPNTHQIQQCATKM